MYCIVSTLLKYLHVHEKKREDGYTKMKKQLATTALRTFSWGLNLGSLGGPQSLVTA